MRAAELLLALLALAVAIAAVIHSGWGVLVWTFLLAGPYLMLVLASRQLHWWNAARAVVVGGGLVVSIVVASVQLRSMGDTGADAGQPVMIAWLVHAGVAIIAMLASAMLTIRRVREVQRSRND